MARLELSLLGGFELRERGGEAVRITVRKAKALLAFLALHPGKPLSRDRLAALLWEESGDAQARHSLRQALSDLRRALPGDDAVPVLRADAETVTLERDRIDVDVVEFERFVDEGAPESLELAVEMLRGEFLEGLNPRSITYEDWLMEQRSRLRELAVGALETLVDVYESSGRREPAIRGALRLVALDPLRESWHRRLMRLYAAQGRIADALKQYRVCRSALRRELDRTPEAKTEKLVEEIRELRDPDVERPDVAETAPPATPERELRALVPCVVRLEIVGPGPLGPEALSRIEERFGEVVASTADRWGGCVAPRLGRSRLITFGFPRARSDDAERAVRAAEEIHAQLSGPEARARIGISSGLVLTSGCDDAAGSGEIVGDALEQATTLAE